MKRAFLFCLALGIVGISRADRHDSAKSVNAGDYPLTYFVTVSSSAATLLVDGSLSIESANIDIFNNSGYTLWIGTNTASLQTTGFPILSSTTYTTSGSFRGSLYGLADSAAAGNTNARTIYYQKNDALR